MLSRRTEIILGLAVMLVASLILWWLIPAYVALPRRPPIRALQPSFWPKIICWMMLLAGVLLTFKAVTGPKPPDSIVERQTVSIPEALRVGGLIFILTAAYFALPVFGMVWVSMVLFIVLVLMTGTKNLVWGVVVGVALPLLLYFFFTKVAGVAIPQGQFVRLP